jgi:hypothetical protein
MLDSEKKKRGRKRINDLYFGPDQENAVIIFLSSDDVDDRNQIYNTFLRKPINKMVESIIRRYKLYRKDICYEDVHTDTLSFLITKASKFKPEKGKKAYSYFGTICKNYLMGQLIKDDKKTKLKVSYEDAFATIEAMPEMMYEIDDTEKIPLDMFFNDIIRSIRTDMTSPKITENETKVGDALITILDRWEDVFESIQGGNKYNKNLILSYIREITSLSTKDIRISMKRFKKVYRLLKNDKLEEGLL